MLSPLAGDLPGFAALTEPWPRDVVATARERLSQGEIDL
jgi:hypothetical protein